MPKRELTIINPKAAKLAIINAGIMVIKNSFDMYFLKHTMY